MIWCSSRCSPYFSGVDRADCFPQRFAAQTAAYDDQDCLTLAGRVCITPTRSEPHTARCGSRTHVFRSGDLSSEHFEVRAAHAARARTGRAHPSFQERMRRYRRDRLHEPRRLAPRRLQPGCVRQAEAARLRGGCAARLGGLAAAARAAVTVAGRSPTA